MIEVGKPFPQFSLKDQSGNTIDNSDYADQVAVVYFYPKDDTPGCTVEACEFQERLQDIPGARVYGVSPDSVTSHQKFADKFKLSFSLLADEEHSLAEEVGVWVEKSMYGKKYMGIERTTVLIGKDGNVVKIWPKVKPQGHAAEVQAEIAKL